MSRISILYDQYKYGLLKAFVGILITGTLIFGNVILKAIRGIIVNDNTGQIQILFDQNKTIIGNQDSMLRVILRGEKTHNSILMEQKKQIRQIYILMESVSKYDKNVMQRFNDIENGYRDNLNLILPITPYLKQNPDAKQKYTIDKILSVKAKKIKKP